MIIVGSATPTISKGCPPRKECITPHIAVDANVSTVLRIPSETNHKIFLVTMKLKPKCSIVVIRRDKQDSLVALLSCSPKAMTGSADAKNIYMVGANILRIHWEATERCQLFTCKI